MIPCSGGVCCRTRPHRSHKNSDFRRAGADEALRWHWNGRETVIDRAGRIVVPKRLRDELGLTPGTTVDISAYGSGVQITPGCRTARLQRDSSGRLILTGDATLTDEAMYSLIDAGRR